MPNQSDLPLVELPDTQRAQVDALALKLPPDAVRKRTRERFRDIKSWLTQRAPLPLSTELQRVRETHKQILTHSKTVELTDSTQNVLARLLDILPTRMTPEAGQFELYLLKRDDWVAASAGQNTLYLSTGALERICSEPSGSDDRLAFILAREIASSCLRHCRSWYQSEWAAAFVRTEKQEREFARIESDDFTGTVLDRKSTAAETYAEDLFALHLCRQAGFKVNTMLDVLRQEVLAEAAELPDEPDSLGGTRTPLRRHRRLLMELRGIVSNEGCGLQRYDGKWKPVGDSDLADTKRAVILLHGLSSDMSAFDGMVTSLRSAIPDSVAILGLTYPDTDSLYRSSMFLIHELARTGAKPEEFDFVCHSAGGLVFRQAAELHGLGFRTATLIGTPNRGSDLASLRPLLEAQEFFGALKGGMSSSVAGAVEDESAQMVRDLEPRSLFLSELNNTSPPNVRSRYNIVRGQALTARKALLLALGVGTARAGLRKLAESSFEKERKESALGWISRLRIPEEVRGGDMAVTLTSATTSDAAEVLTVPTAHTKLPEDPQVIDFVRRTIIGD